MLTDDKRRRDTKGISTMGDIHKDQYDITSAITITRWMPLLHPHYAESVVAIVTHRCVHLPVGVKRVKSSIFDQLQWQ